MKRWTWKDKRILSTGTISWTFKFGPETLYCKKSKDGWWEIVSSREYNHRYYYSCGYRTNLHEAMTEFREEYIKNNHCNTL